MLGLLSRGMLFPETSCRVGDAGSGDSGRLLDTALGRSLVLGTDWLESDSGREDVVRSGLLLEGG